MNNSSFVWKKKEVYVCASCPKMCREEDSGQRKPLTWSPREIVCVTLEKKRKHFKHPLSHQLTLRQTRGLDGRQQECPGFPSMNSRCGGSTYRPSQKFQSRELQVVLLNHSQLRDYDETEGHNEREDVELQKPPQEVEIGKDAGAELASDDLERLLPQADGIEQFRQVVLEPSVCLRVDTKHMAGRPLNKYLLSRADSSNRPLLLSPLDIKPVHPKGNQP